MTASRRAFSIRSICMLIVSSIVALHGRVRLRLARAEGVRQRT